MTNENSRVGCFTGKVPLGSILTELHRPLSMIALRHHVGALKYGYYSWYNHPETSNATVIDNLDAILRHFSAHRMGKMVDPESRLPHIFHACCRAGMLVTSLYRDYNNHHTEMTRKCKDWDIGSQISAEVILVASKLKHANLPDDTAEYPAFINSLLVDDLANKPWIDKDIFAHKICNRIDLLALAIWKYADRLVAENAFEYPLLLETCICRFIQNNIDPNIRGNK